MLGNESMLGNDQETGPCHMGSQDWQTVCKVEMARVVSQYDEEKTLFSGPLITLPKFQWCLFIKTCPACT